MHKRTQEPILCSDSRYINERKSAFLQLSTYRKNFPVAFVLFPGDNGKIIFCNMQLHFRNSVNLQHHWSWGQMSSWFKGHRNSISQTWRRKVTIWKDLYSIDSQSPVLHLIRSDHLILYQALKKKEKNFNRKQASQK